MRRLFQALDVYGVDMIIKIIPVLIITALLSFFVGVKYNELSMGNKLLYASYADSAISIKHHLAMLNNLREGNDVKTIKHLEHLLDFDQIMLSGCFNDLCKNSSNELFTEALKLSKDYQDKYMIDKSNEH